MTISAAFSAIIITGALVLPEVIVGMVVTGFRLPHFPSGYAGASRIKDAIGK